MSISDKLEGLLPEHLNEFDAAFIKEFYNETHSQKTELRTVLKALKDACGEKTGCYSDHRNVWPLYWDSAHV